MTTAYTSLLGLALPVQGELQGTWGDTVNTQITQLLDTAVAGTTTLSTDADVTLTTTTGASNQARQAILLWTANGTTTRNITAPAQSKIYTVINNSAGTQSIVIRGVGPTTGVTVPKGKAIQVVWNGSDFVELSPNSITGNLTVNGTLTVTSTATINSLTAGRVTFAGASGLLSDSSAFVWDAVNSRLGINSASPADRLSVGGAVLSTGATVLTTTEGAIFDYNNPEGRLIAYRGAGSAISLWTNSSGGSLARRFYLDGLGRLALGTGGSTSAPAGWSTQQSVIELGGGSAWNSSNTTGGTMSITSNAYFDGTNWLTRDAGYAARLDLLGKSDGTVTLSTTSASASSGGAITWDNTLTLTRTNVLTLGTSSTGVNSGFVIQTLSTAGYSVVELKNTGASGRIYQMGVGGSTATPANQWYVYDGTPGAGAVRMAINGSGQVGFGTTSQSAKLHTYSDNADGASMFIDTPTANNDAGIRFRTALGDYKVGTGIGAAANAYIVYDIGGSAQRFRIGPSGFTTVGTSTNQIAKLAVQVSSSTGNVSNWGGGQFVVTTGGGTQGSGLGISYDDAGIAANISALQPGISWRKLNLRVKELAVLMNGADTALFFDDGFKQPSTPYRHAFKARNPQGTNQPSGTTLIFGTVDLNQGSRYNSTNGRFTAAVAGLYHFSHTALTFNVTNYFYASFWVNGGTSYVAWHTPVTSPDYQGYGISMTVYLSAGDYVECVTQYNGGSPYVEGGSGSSRTSFSGHFIG